VIEADQQQCWKVQSNIAGYRKEPDETQEHHRQLTSNTKKPHLKQVFLLEDLEISNKQKNGMTAQIDVLEMIGLLETVKEGLKEQPQLMKGKLQTKIDDLQKMIDELEAQSQEIEGKEMMYQDLITSLYTK
jgi:hypothetical protein